MIDWSWWADAAWEFLWPVIVAVPGFIAFWWQWRDRWEAQAPFVTAFASQTFPDLKGDWVPVQFFVRNNLSVPIEVTEIRLIGPEGALQFMDYSAPSRAGRTVSPSRPTDTVKVSWVLPAGADTASVFSGTHGRETLAFVGSTEASTENMRLSIACKFRKHSSDRRSRRITATSEPIDVKRVTI